MTYRARCHGRRTTRQRKRVLVHEVWHLDEDGAVLHEIRLLNSGWWQRLTVFDVERTDATDRESGMRLLPR